MQKNKDVTRLYEMLCPWRQAAAMLEAEEELPRRLQQVALLPRVRQQPEPRQDAAGGPYLTLSLVGHGKGHLLHKIRKFR